MHNFSISVGILFSIVLVHTQCISTVNCSNGHRHRHHHHHQSNSELSSDGQTGSEDSEFVPAYRVTEVPANQDEVEDQGNEDQDDDSGRQSSSLEYRLATLEDDVRHLCLEDEEDVERRISALGVKCICPKTEAPVCGSDNVTYYNRCYLHCRAQQAEMSYHRYKITLKKFGRC